MNEPTVLLTNRAYLDTCMAIEGLCADLYHHYSKIYEETPEASRLWKKTALEEENHQNQFKLALRLLNDTDFEVPKDNLKRIHSIHHKLLKLWEDHKNSKPDLLDAVSKAVEMEKQMEDLHVHTLMHFKEPSLKNLFKALSEADHDHISTLQQYRTLLNPS
jgi:rubrerythrin